MHEQRQDGPQSVSRRRFLRDAIAGLAAAGLGGRALAAGPLRISQAEQEAGQEQPRMLYRPIESCGIKVSTIVSGPAGDEVQQRMAAFGVNYYHKVDGCGSKQFRQSVDWDRNYCDVVIDNLDRDKAIQEFEARRDKAGVDVVHFFKIHATLRRPEDIESNPQIFEAFETLKDQGKTLWLATSLHSGADMLEACVESGLFKQIQIMFNPLRADEATMAALAKAKQKGIGIIAMKPMMGGPENWEKNPKAQEALKQIQQVGSTPGQSLLKWVLAQEGITAAVPKCANVSQAEEACTAVLARLTPDEERAVQALAAALSHDYCRLCGSCEAVCPKGLPVSDILRYRMYALGYGETSGASALYSRLPAQLRANACTECGACEKACPYGLRVVRLLKDAHRVLA
ncbi:MAG: aldo/keto reductase [Armatimonadetes bacterium]|nr:aldo/keto reductase [Armatimonadota bacterium]